MRNILLGTTPVISGYTGTYSGTPAGNASDGNFSSYSGYYFIERGGNSYFYNGAHTTWTWTFPATNIQKMVWKIYDYAQTQSGASENTAGYGIWIYVTNGAGTQTIVSEGITTFHGDASGGYSQNNNTVTYSTPISGATQIQIDLYGQAKRVDAGAGGGNEWLYHYVYEMQAFAPSGYASIF